LCLGLFHFARFLGFGFQFRDADLLLLDLLVGAELFVLLLLQEQTFKPLCVLVGKVCS
jgi:hypothetical protein